MQKLIISTNGSRLWKLDKEWHRIGGAAFEWSNGIKFWYKEGERHRIKGPAFEFSGALLYLGI